VLGEAFDSAAWLPTELSAFPGVEQSNSNFLDEIIVNNLKKRAIGAALACVLLPTAATAAPDQSYPAIAAGMAIPSGNAGLQLQTPASNGQSRAVLIDAASATLHMIEDGRIVDSMKVIVGKPSAATPELRTSLTYATLNPYWHVPTDLARTLTAPNVLKYGTSYLTERGYEVLSEFGPGARVIDPETVDWEAVAAGEAVAYVRQRPGPANSMGEMKFSLAAGDGIYLHDTPRKELFEEEDRGLSAGCVRLEDADRFARWLLGPGAPLEASMPEQHVALRGQVPVVITYLNPRAQSQLAMLR
jgi:L,D-transpeptidase YcbB